MQRSTSFAQYVDENDEEMGEEELDEEYASDAGEYSHPHVSASARQTAIRGTAQAGMVDQFSDDEEDFARLDENSANSQNF